MGHTFTPLIQHQSIYFSPASEQFAGRNKIPSSRIYILRVCFHRVEDKGKIIIHMAVSGFNADASLLTDINEPIGFKTQRSCLFNQLGDYVLFHFRISGQDPKKGFSRPAYNGIRVVSLIEFNNVVTTVKRTPKRHF